MINAPWHDWRVDVTLSRALYTPFCLRQDIFDACWAPPESLLYRQERPWCAITLFGSSDAWLAYEYKPTSGSTSVKPLCISVSHTNSHLILLSLQSMLITVQRVLRCTLSLFWSKWRMKLGYRGPWHVTPAQLQPVSTLTIRLETKIRTEISLTFWS